MVVNVHADVPYDPQSNPELYAEAQKLLKVTHEENQRVKATQAQQEEAQKLALRAKVDQALGLPADPNKLIEVVIGMTSPVGKVKAFATAASETAVGHAVGEVATHYKESILNGAKDLGGTLKDVAPKSPRDLAHLLFTPQNASPERMEAFKKLGNEAVDENKLIAMQLAAVPYGWVGLAGTAAIGAAVVSSKSDNEKLADSFQRAHDNGFTREKTLEGMNKLKESDSPEMKAAVNMYLNIYEHLGHDGELSTQDKAIMRAATQNITEKLKAGEPVIALGASAGVENNVVHKY